MPPATAADWGINMSVEKYIKDNVGSLIVADKVYIAPNIPEKKLNAAVSSMAPDIDPDYVIAVVDTSLLSGAKDGCLFTGDAIYFHSLGLSAYKVFFTNIQKVEYIYTEVVNEKGKIEKTEKVVIQYKGGQLKDITNFIPLIKKKKLAEMINGIILEVGESGEFVTNSQATPLSMMDENIKMDYIKIMCNFSYSDTQVIGSKEYSEIISLIVRINLNAPSRLLIRNYMMDGENHEENVIIIKRLEQCVEESSFELIKKSLMKDILYLHRVRNRDLSWKDNTFIVKLQETLRVSTEQIEYIVDAIKSDEEILEKRKSDTEIKKSMKEIAAKATAVGVPLAAIYLSGSVLGVSAAGLTSGLAALGMGGILGFSSMFTGIGVAVLIGVGTYKGVKKITGISDLENNKQRELMIQAIIKASQKSMNYLIEDINEITQQLRKELEKGLQNELVIQKISGLLARLCNGAQVTSDRIQYAQKESIISKLPKNLDKVRLFELTTQPTKEKYRRTVLACYTIENVVDDDGKTKELYVLNDQIGLGELEQLHLTFEAIGYFSIKDAAVASAKGFVKNVANTIKG